MGRAIIVNTGWPARKNDPLRFQRSNFVSWQVKPNDFGINLTLANPPGDYLSILRTEIEDEDFTMGRERCSFHNYGCCKSGSDGVEFGSFGRSSGPRVPCPVM